MLWPLNRPTNKLWSYLFKQRHSVGYWRPVLTAILLPPSRETPDAPLSPAFCRPFLTTAWGGLLLPPPHYATVFKSHSKWESCWQEAQLPQRNSASAAHMEGGGLGPPAHSPFSPSGYTNAYGRIRKPQRTYVKRAVRKAHLNMNRAFEVIQGHPYWCCLLYTSPSPRD